MPQFELTKEQEVAVSGIVKSNDRVVVLQAGAGCGKTVCISHIYSRLKEIGDSIVVCATTNKAVQVLAENGLPNPMTVHCALSLDINSRPNGKFRLVTRYTTMIVDEMSMMSERMLEEALKYVKRIILVGDKNQLVVNKMCDISRYKHFYLRKNMRSSDKDILDIVKRLKGAVEGKGMPKIVSNGSITVTDKFDDIVTTAKSRNCKLLAYKNTNIDKYIELGIDAISIHKAQGSSYDMCIVDAQDVIASYVTKNRQANKLTREEMLKLLYVAISRAREEVLIFVNGKRSFAKYRKDVRC